MYHTMNKLGFDESDYSVVVKNRAPPPNPWRWEIYRAGRSNPIGHSPILFRTMVAANSAGKAALKQLLAKLNSSQVLAARSAPGGPQGLQFGPVAVPDELDRNPLA